MKQYLIIANSCVLATTVFALSALDDASNYEGGWISLSADVVLLAAAEAVSRDLANSVFQLKDAAPQ